MEYTDKEIKEMIDKIHSYERIIDRMLLKFHRMEKAKKNKVIHEECIIHLSFSGLNKACSLQDSEPKESP